MKERASGPLGILFAALLLFSSPLALVAQEELREEILAYDVRIEVRRGGAMRVTEEIEVRALGREIRRGIYRDFPTHFPREGGLGSVVAPFEVRSVSRDGRPEPYTVRSVAGPEGRSGARVRIGREDVFLPQGVYRYTVVYETARWLRFGEDADRLDWNVTGNGWSFPIRRATAVVRLPGSAPADEVELEAWTGPEGATERDATWEWTAEDNAARFRTTDPLDPGEGLTVRVSVPKGVVPPPTEEQLAAWFRLDWGGYLEAGVVVAAVLALYLLMWVRVGRDPDSGTIVVRYDPPDGFSPAALGYLRERGYDPAHLTAALVSLAVKGAVTIEQDGREWRIREAGPLPDDASREERRLHGALLGAGTTLTLTGSSSERLRKGVKALKKQLERQLEKDYFVTNRLWFAAGAVASVAGFAVLAWRARFDVGPEVWFLGVWLTFWSMGVGTLLVRVVRTWSRAVSGDPFAAVGAVFITLFSVPFVAGEIFVGGMLYRWVPGHLVTAVVAIAVVNVAFYHLLERPTLKGRGVLDRLEGFRRFLGATEEDRLDRLQRPDRSLELFERFLPHAIALGVENEWAERFQDALTPAPRSGGAGHGALGWYSGDGAGGLDLAGVSSSLGSSFSSSLSASSAAPSGGGGGGGGSSGGGGGGGGGGGW